jgi:HTH-type transcriptional regulator, sugar sensing transcriptional regulator
VSDPILSLIALGFTSLEAAVYSFLLKESPASGYRIAQGIRKPFANTYQAISSLQTKGAILINESEGKLCRAVPPVELLDQLKKVFLKSRADALKALSGISDVATDLGVYQLTSRDQVLERFRMMLKSCKEVAICTIFPQLIKEVRLDLEVAGRRGLKIALTAYEPVVIRGIDVVIESRRKEILKRWPGQWLNLVVDGKEHLIALLQSDGNGVHYALWTGNVYLSWIYHSAVAAALIGTVFSKEIEGGTSISKLRKNLRHFRKFLGAEALGYRTLQQQFFDTKQKTRSRNASSRSSRKRFVRS